MKTSQLFPVLALLVSFSAHAADGVVKQDNKQIQQDKQNVHSDKSDVKSIQAKIAQDKKSGDTAQLAKDQEALKEARRNKKEAVNHLKTDKAQRDHDVKNP